MTHLTREQVEDLVMTYGGKVCVCVHVCVCVCVCVFIHHSLVLTGCLLMCPPHIYPLHQSTWVLSWLNNHIVEWQSLNLYVIKATEALMLRAWMSSAYTVPSFLPYFVHVLLPDHFSFSSVAFAFQPTNLPCFLLYFFPSFLPIFPPFFLPSLPPFFLPFFLSPSACILDATLNLDCKRSIGQNKLSSRRNSLGWWSTSRWEQQVQNCDRKKGT